LQKNLENPENCVIFVSEKETNKNTTIMDTIFTTLVVLFIGVVSIMIFIQTNVELWNEVGKDLWNDMKSTVISWFNGTKMGMWYKNKKNKVEILSDRKYNLLLKSGQIKNIIVVED
jgi:hypothetical protein